MEDADEFSALYRRESDTVLLFLARRTLDAEVAVELTAETFAIALRSWVRLRELSPEQARAWLFTVARRLYGRYLRRARVERQALERLGIRTPVLSGDDIAAIERLAGLSDLRALVAGELARLSEPQREALRLRVVEELPYERVAARLGISEHAARARVSRGLRALAAALEPRWRERELTP